MVDGIPVTSVARTLLDLAWKLSGDQLARVLARAEELELLDLDALRAVIERNRGHHGAKRLRLALATYEPADLHAAPSSSVASSPTSSPPAYRVPSPAGTRSATSSTSTGPSVASASNSTPMRRTAPAQAFERDHDRDLDFALADIETIRVSERQFRREPDEIAAKSRQLLDRRAARST